MTTATRTDIVRELLDDLAPACEMTTNTDVPCPNPATHIVTVTGRLDGRLIAKIAECTEHVEWSRQHRATCPFCTALIDYRAEPI